MIFKMKIRPVEGRKEHQTRKVSSFRSASLYGLVIGLLGLATLSSCKVIEYVPVKGDTVVEYRDSVITKLDTITITRTEVEKVRDYTGLLDVLEMETKYSKATAWVDTSASVLKGTLEDKPVPVQVVVPSTVEYHQKDSIQVIQIPIEVERQVRYIPRWCWYSLVFNILVLLLIILGIYFKIFKF